MKNWAGFEKSRKAVPSIFLNNVPLWVSIIDNLNQMALILVSNAALVNNLQETKTDVIKQYTKQDYKLKLILTKN